MFKAFRFIAGFVALLSAFSLATSALAQTVTSLSMTSDSGDYIGQGQTYFLTPTDGTFSAQVNYDGGVSIIYQGFVPGDFWNLDFSAPDNVSLSQGTYLNATRFPFQLLGVPGLAVYGDGRGCNNDYGNFTVLQVVYGPGSTVSAFDATFEQHCESPTAPALRGEIRYNANVVLSVNAPTNLKVVENQNLMFTVTGVDQQLRHVTLTASNLPAGAKFTDLGNNSGSFSWTPTSVQAGTYVVTFTGDNGAGNTTTASTQLVVIPPPPPNDDVLSATQIYSFPYSLSEDVTTATVAPTDPWCYGDAQTVWFKYTATSNVRLEANTFGSNYDTTLSVYTGTPPNALLQLACNDDSNGTVQSRTIFDAVAGTTYYFMASSLYYPIAQASLVFNLLQGPPPFSMVPTVEQFGSVVNSTGKVTISGTVTCNASAYVTLNGQVKELKQKQPVAGYFNTFFPCDGATPWSATVTPDGIARGHGRSLLMFGSGKANVGIQAYATDPDTGEFKNVNVTTVVQLRGK